MSNSRLSAAEKKRQTRVAYDTISESYSQYRQNPWIECVRPLRTLSARPVVLEAGAGSGRQTFAIAEFCSHVLAVDFSSVMLRRLWSKAKEGRADGRISAIVADLVEMPVRQESVDGVEMVAALHHVPSCELREEASREAYRTLKPGGLWVATVWSRYQRGFARVLPVSLLRSLLRRGEFGDAWIPWGKSIRFYHLCSKRELRRLAERVGFSTIHVETKSFGRSSSDLDKNIFLEARKL